MKEVLNVILLVVAFFLLGAFATFFVILNTRKEEIWEEIYRRYIRWTVK